jgi:hypothetical protein
MLTPKRPLDLQLVPRPRRPKCEFPSDSEGLRRRKCRSPITVKLLLILFSTERRLTLLLQRLPRLPTQSSHPDQRSCELSLAFATIN